MDKRIKVNACFINNSRFLNWNYISAMAFRTFDLFHMIYFIFFLIFHFLICNFIKKAADNDCFNVPGRRKIEDAMKVQKSIYNEFYSRSTTEERRSKILKDNPAFAQQHWLLAKIGMVFKIERSLSDEKAELDKIKKVRETQELPILEEIHAKILEIREKFLPFGKFLIAINYMINQWDKLIYYISHPEVPPTNNLIEREGVKPFVMTRKNVLFANSIEGAENMMNWFTLFTSAKMNNVNVEKYIAYALRELSTHRMTDETIGHLLPYSPNLPEGLKIKESRD